MIKQSFLSLLLMLAGFSAAAKERFSYLYVQGDKQTPFYLKLDGAMQPRYGKNYCILPQLAPGPLQIEILFQQNVFPPEKFTVLIPDGGSRGFLLVKKDGAYSLYDLQQGFYLQPGNAASDDHLPAANAVTAPMTEAVVAKAEDAAEKEPPLLEARRNNKTADTKPLHKSSRPPKKQSSAHHGRNAAPAFIPDIELGHQADADAAPMTTEQGVTDQKSPRPPAIHNSDCPTPMSSEEFSKIFNTMSGHSSDEERLSYILGQMDKCYQSWQARALAQMLSTEAARFTLLKHIYSRISDQGEFPLLDDLFSTDTWKAAFSKMVNR
jgi:hypothetical protein